MPVSPIHATDYVSLAQLNGAGKLDITKLSNNPARFPTSKEVMSANPAKIAKISAKIPGNVPTIQDLSNAVGIKRSFDIKG